MSRRRLLAPVLALLTAVAAFGLAGTGSADAVAAYAPADQATITPGVQMFTNGAQCTANFVFTDGASTYLGYAAHCAGLGAATDTDGCLAGSLPLGTAVEIDGAANPGRLAYSSWLTMENELAAGRAVDQNACSYNDFALVRINPADVASVNPSVPHWGGPTGLRRGGIGTGATMHSYGNSSLRFGITLLSPKTGLSLGTTGGGWTHPVYTVTPGIPGDSGSGMLDGQGRAAGVLSTVAIAPLALSNNFSDLASALDYANSVGGMNVRLVPGDVGFNSAQLPLGLGFLGL